MCDCSGRTTLGRLGGNLGDKIQHNALKRFKNWTGLGDYNIVGNSLISSMSTDGDQPTIETRGRSTIIRYREYLGDVTTHPHTVGAFHPVTYDINPGNPITFPWLSGLALRYEQYKPRGIIFEFRSTATDTTTAASLGSIMMSSEYDPKDTLPTTKAEMVNSAYSSEAKMTSNLLHGIECDPSELQRNIFYCQGLKSSLATVDPDIQDYQICRTTIATQGGGLDTNSSVGSLYVHYEFEFFKEQSGIQAPDLIYARYINANPLPVDNILQNFSMTRRTGYDIGIYFLVNRIYIPKQWAGRLFVFRFYFSTTGAATPGAGGVGWSLSGCRRVDTYLSPTGIPTAASGIWNERAPGPAPGALAAGSYWTYGMVAFLLDGVLSEDAECALTSPDDFGIWMTSTTGTKALQIDVEILPPDYYQSRA